MADRVQAIKWESPSHGGTQTDTVPTEIDPNEDGLDARSVFFQDDSSNDSDVEVSRDASGNITFKDKVTSIKTLAELSAGGGMTPETHRQLDQLTHELDESYFEEYIYSGSIIDSVVVWDSPSKTTKIREYSYTYSGGRVTQEVAKQYDGSGVLVETLTYTYSYTGSRLDSVTAVRT